MHTTVTISSDLNRAIMLRSKHQRNKKRSKILQQLPRQEAHYNTKSYNDGLQRAFNKAKEQVYFNPDMTNFITLTYAENQQDLEQVMLDIKQFIKYEKRQRSNPVCNGRDRKLKYIYILEYQKRGALHVHMIANNSFTTYRNKNGYQSLKYWTKGYSSVLQISDFDNNFRPHLYLFKYMKKSQRIGKSFVHSSRNLTNYTVLETSEINLIQWRTVNMEFTETLVETTTFQYSKNYLQYDDTIDLLTNEGNKLLWLEKVKAHSTKELEKLVKNHTQLYS